MVLTFEDYLNEGLFGGTGIKFDHYRYHGYCDNASYDSFAFILLGKSDKNKLQSWKEIEKALIKFQKKLEGNYRITNMYVYKDDKKLFFDYFGGEDEMKKAMNTCKFKDFKYVKSTDPDTSDLNMKGNDGDKQFTITSTYGPGLKVVIEDPKIDDELELYFDLEEIKRERYRD